VRPELVELACSGETHRVWVGLSGLEILDHDVEGERVLETLGGRPPACLELAAAWRWAEHADPLALIGGETWDNPRRDRHLDALGAHTPAPLRALSAMPERIRALAVADALDRTHRERGRHRSFPAAPLLERVLHGPLHLDTDTLRDVIDGLLWLAEADVGAEVFDDREVDEIGRVVFSHTLALSSWREARRPLLERVARIFLEGVAYPVERSRRILQLLHPDGHVFESLLCFDGMVTISERTFTRVPRGHWTVCTTDRARLAHDH